MEVVLLCFLVVFLVLVAVWTLKTVNWLWLKPMKMKKYLKKQGIDGPSYKLFYGNLKEIVSMMKKARSKPMELSHHIAPRLLPFDDQTVKVYGKMFVSWIGPTPRLNIMDPELIREILSNKFGHFGKVRSNPLGKLLATGLVSYQDEKWVKHRRIINPAFHQEKLKMMLPAFYACCSFRFIPTKRNRKMKEIHREVHTLLRVMIEKREKAMKSGKASSDDLLGILMESNFKEIKEGGNAKNLGMSIDDVIEECKLFYFAGQETTSTLLVWTMIVLSMHPEWQVKAREEVLRVFGRDKPNFEGLNHLKVVTMILNEVLRLYPPGIMLTRVTYKTIELGNLRLPPHVELSLPIILVHHDRELWGEDAEEFNPERFSEGISNATKNQVSFFPFGWGPRICIGQAFALTEAKMALAMILQNFWFELSATYTHAPFTIVTLQPQHGAQLILHKL
ncbi:Cytochrome p450 [Thalictrum thalictroides]|uniref:Cytochrome p450 n=1 Tax=Thalictrum thalictroides TaxID=46969 RepID=A0A7J6WRK0_THATH|nr:Cytochrome p450 [Thalictrum thalictroides]